MEADPLGEIEIGHVLTGLKASLDAIDIGCRTRLNGSAGAAMRVSLEVTPLRIIGSPGGTAIGGCGDRGREESERSPSGFGR